MSLSISPSFLLSCKSQTRPVQLFASLYLFKEALTSGDVKPLCSSSFEFHIWPPGSLVSIGGLSWFVRQSSYCLCVVKAQTWILNRWAFTLARMNTISMHESATNQMVQIQRQYVLQPNWSEFETQLRILTAHVWAMHVNAVW